MQRGDSATGMSVPLSYRMQHYSDIAAMALKSIDNNATDFNCTINATKCLPHKQMRLPRLSLRLPHLSLRHDPLEALMQQQEHHIATMKSYENNATLSEDKSTATA